MNEIVNVIVLFSVIVNVRVLLLKIKRILNANVFIL